MRQGKSLYSHAGAMEHEGMHQDDVALFARHLVEAAVGGVLDDLIVDRVLKRGSARLVAGVHHRVEAFGMVELVNIGQYD